MHRHQRLPLEQIQSDLEDRILRLEPRLSLLNKLHYASQNDPVAQLQLEDAKRQTKRDIEQLSRYGISASDVFARFKATIMKADVIRAQDTINEERLKGHNTVVDLLDEEKETDDIYKKKQQEVLQQNATSVIDSSQPKYLPVFLNNIKALIHDKKLIAMSQEDLTRNPHPEPIKVYDTTPVEITRDIVVSQLPIIESLSIPTERSVMVEIPMYDPLDTASKRGYLSAKGKFKNLQLKATMIRELKKMKLASDAHEKAMTGIEALSR